MLVQLSWHWIVVHCCIYLKILFRYVLYACKILTYLHLTPRLNRNMFARFISPLVTRCLFSVHAECWTRIGFQSTHEVTSRTWWPAFYDPNFSEHRENLHWAIKVKTDLCCWAFWTNQLEELQEKHIYDWRGISFIFASSAFQILVCSCAWSRICSSK